MVKRTVRVLGSHRFASLLTLFLLSVWLPTDVGLIREGLEGETRLAVGISLKIFMHLVAVVGLWLDKTVGYAFLLGASLQGLLVAVGPLIAIPVERWVEYSSALWWPLTDVILRITCLIYLATRPGRIVGKEST